MGLDQYAYKLTESDPTEREEIAYWRKHPNLQGWMENLWRSNGGEGEFNCVDVELTVEDLDDLEQSINDSALPETTGFFFGSDSDDHYLEQDREFIKEAREAIAKGYVVLYSSWW